MAKAHQSQVMNEAPHCRGNTLFFDEQNVGVIFSAHLSETRAAAKESVDGVISKVWWAKDLGHMGKGRASEVAKKNRRTPISTASLVDFRAALLPRPPCAHAGDRTRDLWLGKHTPCFHPLDHVDRACS